MSAAAFFAILALIGLAACAAVWLAERDVERQDRARLAQVEAATKPSLRAVPDRGWHGTNYEVIHHPTARKVAGGWLAACRCRFNCLSLDPYNDVIYEREQAAKAAAAEQLAKRGAM